LYNSSHDSSEVILASTVPQKGSFMSTTKRNRRPAGTQGGGDQIKEEGYKSLHLQQCRNRARLATFIPIWSDDRRHFQGWETQGVEEVI
jgi:hypothetical protein